MGRTGAGKSTLCLVLSRILEAEKGSILIDGINTANIKIDVLRSKLTVIPQEPIIFAETIRFNLDPTGTVPDQEIEDILKLAGLEELLKREPEGETRKKANEKALYADIDPEQGNGKGIYFKLEDGGKSLSVGEKQLICICRAVLRKNKIVVLDEATASIDVVTEQKIYKLIDTAFKHSTVITVAHRLETVLKSDKILMIDEGKNVGFDTPEVLSKD